MKSNIRPRRTTKITPTRKSEDKQVRQDRLDKWARSESSDRNANLARRDAKGNVGEYRT